MKRKCEECLADVQAVCRHAFGKYWNDKSTNGEGCDYPLDAVAEAWYARGWKPGTGATMRLTLPLKDAPKMPTRPRRPTASKIQSGMPTRPKVSAALMRQAELFFGTKK
jgi:hypothetical protein